MTNKERCKKCIYKAVCLYKDYYAGLENIEKCIKYKPKPKKEVKIDFIIPCICTTHAPNVSDSVYYGMPQLTASNSLKKGLQFWGIKCPNCGRLGIGQYKSPQLALQDWNRVQTDLYAAAKREIKIFEEIEMECYKWPITRL